MSKPRILYFDIETSLMEVYTFYIGRKVSITHNQIKSNSRIICICYSWDNSKKVESLHWDTKTHDDTKMLIKFNKIAAEADLLVGHNGKNFDVKEIRTAMALRDIKESWCETPVLDTLKDYRRAFRFKSNKLDAVSKELGFSGKKPMGMQDWIDVNNNSKEALTKMIKYCKIDVRELRNVHRRLDYYVPPSMTDRKLKTMNRSNTKRFSCIECKGNEYIKYGVYSYKGQACQKYLCKECHKINMPEKDNMI